MDDDDRQKREQEIYEEEKQKLQEGQDRLQTALYKGDGSPALRPDEKTIRELNDPEMNDWELKREAAERTDKRMAEHDSQQLHREKVEQSHIDHQKSIEAHQDDGAEKSRSEPEKAHDKGQDDEGGFLSKAREKRDRKRGHDR